MERQKRTNRTEKKVCKNELPKKKGKGGKEGGKDFEKWGGGDTQRMMLSKNLS